MWEDPDRAGCTETVVWFAVVAAFRVPIVTPWPDFPSLASNPFQSGCPQRHLAIGAG